MTLSDIAAIAGVASSLAVLVSLIYLALQIRQSAANQRAETQSAVTARRVDYLMRMTERDMQEMTIRGHAGDPEITTVQAMQYLTSMNAAMTSFEDEFFQHRSGMLDEQRFRLHEAVNRAQFIVPGSRAFWRIAKGAYHPDFVAHIDAIIWVFLFQIIGDPSAMWRAAVAEERAAAATL